jgi:hypothetical protein
MSTILYYQRSMIAILCILYLWLALNTMPDSTFSNSDE